MLKFHLTCWFICFLSYIALSVVFNKRLRRYKTKIKTRFVKKVLNEIKGWIYFALVAFVPLLNILMLFVLMYMVFCSNEKAAKLKAKAVSKTD